MRIESSVTSISWIPSEAVQGVTKVPFEMGLAHYDDPPPDHVDSLAALQEADRFRFANHLSAWIEVDGGRIVDRGQAGGGQIGSTTISLGGRGMTFAAVAFPDKRPVPVAGDGWVRFTQTAGGRTGVPAPRKVESTPVRPARGTARVDEPDADALLRREVAARAHRRQPVPAPLGLRPRSESRSEVGLGGLQALVSARIRVAHALGRRGFAGAGHRGRDGVGAGTLTAHHARRAETSRPQDQGGRDPRGAGR